MDKLNNIDDLKLEFDKFVKERCITDVNKDEEEMESLEDIPNFAHALTDLLLAPSRCGANITRLDIKRIGDEVNASIPIKERKRMWQALFRHIVTKNEIEEISNALNKHLDGRILIYKDISKDFPSSKKFFNENIGKIESTKEIFRQVVDDFEEFDPEAESVEM